MPPLPSKRLLGGIDDEDYDYDEERQVKRQRDDSPSDIYDYEEDFEKPQESEELGEPEGTRRHEEIPDNNATKDVADEIVGLMLPRLETHLQQLVNGVALRMLNALGTRLNRLESRMEEMQREWKKSVKSSGIHLKETPGQQRVERQRHVQSQQRQHHPVTPEDSETQTTKTPQAAVDSLDTFLQEAARVADSPDITFPLENRKQPFMTRRSKPYPAPALMRTSTFGAYERSPLTALPADPTIQPENVPQYRLERSLQTIVELWHEFFVGSEVKPAINELDQKFGSMWRWKNAKETTYYGLRRVIIDEITNRVESRCPDATAATGDVWLTVCEEMDRERIAVKASLNQYTQELKRRERLKSPPPKPPPVALYPEATPESPVLSRSTVSVAELWVEWFEGKRDYNGYTVFPSIIELNARFGDAWRRAKTAEYAIYLKRRCIIDIALGKMLQQGGDWEETKQKVISEMDVERMKHGLNIVQYNQWARENCGYHASRTRVPMEMVELGLMPEGFGEQAAGGQELGGSMEEEQQDGDEVSAEE